MSKPGDSREVTLSSQEIPSEPEMVCEFRPVEAILITAMWLGFFEQTMKPLAIASTPCESLLHLTILSRTANTLLIAIRHRFRWTLSSMPALLHGQYVSNAVSRERREQPTTVVEAA